MIRLVTAKQETLLVTPDQPLYARFLPGAARFDVALVKEVGLGAVLVSGQRGLRETSERRFFYRSAPTGGGGSEEIFLLGSYPSEKGALLARKLFNATYGIPESTGGYRDMDREHWRRFFREVDTLWRCQELLETLGMNPREPHWVQRSLSPAALRKHLLLEAEWVDTSWKVDIRRPSRNPGSLIRLEPRGEIEQLPDLSSYERLDHVDIDRRYHLGANRPYRRLRAAAVRPGMGLPRLEGKQLREDTVVVAERIQGEGLVYRLEAPESLGLLVEGLVIGRGSA
jgi:hypothetical protein